MPPRCSNYFTHPFTTPTTTTTQDLDPNVSAQFPHQPELDNSISKRMCQLHPPCQMKVQTNVCVTHYKSKPIQTRAGIITSSPPPHHDDHDVPSTQSVESSLPPPSPSSLPSVEQHKPPPPP